MSLGVTYYRASDGTEFAIDVRSFVERRPGHILGRGEIQWEALIIGSADTALLRPPNEIGWAPSDAQRAAWNFIDRRMIPAPSGATRVVIGRGYPLLGVSAFPCDDWHLLAEELAGRLLRWEGCGDGPWHIVETRRFRKWITPGLHAAVWLTMDVASDRRERLAVSIETLTEVRKIGGD